MDRRAVIFKFGAAATIGLAGCLSDGGSGTTTAPTDTQPEATETMQDTDSTMMTGSPSDTAEAVADCPDPPTLESDIGDLLPSDPLNSGVIAGSVTTSASAVAATEVGRGTFEDTGGTQYRMEVVRWRSETVAAEAIGLYEAVGDLDLVFSDGDIVSAENMTDGQDATMQTVVARGVYTFSVFGPDPEAARQVLTASSAVTAGCL